MKYLFLLLILLIIGCDSQQVKSIVEEVQSAGQSKREPTLFQTRDGAATLLFPAGWYENRKEHPYELQCVSKTENMNTGVFVYHMEDLAADFTPEKLLQSQVDDLMAKRNNPKIIESEKTVQEGTKTITRVVYSGEKGVSTNYYAFSMVQFKAPDAPILLVIQVAIPSQWKQNEPILSRIVKSAKLI